MYHSVEFVQIFNFIQNNYQSVNLKELAVEFGYSSPYLSRVIKQQTGQTFTELITELKINKAQFLLKNSSFSVNEIAFEVGYNSDEHFIRTFKNVVHQTPNNFRKRNRELH